MLRSLVISLLMLGLVRSEHGCQDGPGYWCNSCEAVMECSYMIPDLMEICVNFSFLTWEDCDEFDIESYDVWGTAESASTATSWNPTSVEQYDIPSTSKPASMELRTTKYVEDLPTEISPTNEDEATSSTEEPATENNMMVTDKEMSETEISTVDTGYFVTIRDEETVGRSTLPVQTFEPTAKNNAFATMSKSNGDVDAIDDEDLGEPKDVIYEGDHSSNDAPMTKTCSVFGRGHQHVLTFDGSKYSVQGECSYVLSMDCTSDRQWIIYGLFSSCGRGTTCLTAITIYYENSYLILDRGWVAYYQGEPLKLKLKEIVHFGKMELYFDGLYLSVNTPSGLTIAWNGLRNVHITVPVTMKETCGMCDPMSGEEGGYLTRNNVVTEDVAEFVGSWKIDRLNECYKPVELKTSDHKTLCGRKQRSEGAALCRALLREQSASACGDALDQQWFIDQCVQDWCVSQDPTNEETWMHAKLAECGVMSAFVKHCNSESIANVNEFWWRAFTKCPNLDETQSYTLLDGVAPWHDAYGGRQY